MSLAQVSRKVVKSVYATEQAEGVGARVRRTIGTPGLRNLTPFLMLDHFNVGPGAGFPDHPHRGQVTCTYMIEGQFQHEDNKGHRGVIGPGDVQWMVAGKGIMHSEMPIHKPNQPNPQGLQLWVDLPEKFKDVEPSYQEKKASEISTVRPKDGVEITVISGESHGTIGPVRSLGGCWLMDIKLSGKGDEVFQPLPAGWTGFLYTLDGSLGVGEDSTIYQKHHTLVFSSSESENGVLLRNVSPSGLTRVVLIAGEPLDQEVVQYGPFVVTSQMKARQAIMDFQLGQNGFENAPGWRSEIGKVMTQRG